MLVLGTFKSVKLSVLLVGGNCIFYAHSLSQVPKKCDFFLCIRGGLV